MFKYKLSDGSFWDVAPEDENIFLIENPDATKVGDAVKTFEKKGNIILLITQAIK